MPGDKRDLLQITHSVTRLEKFFHLLTLQLLKSVWESKARLNAQVQYLCEYKSLDYVQRNNKSEQTNKSSSLAPRCGSAGAAWRSTPAPTWATSSLKRPLTPGPTSCRTPYEPQKFGWTPINNTSTTGILRLKRWDGRAGSNKLTVEYLPLQSCLL